MAEIKPGASSRRNGKKSMTDPPRKDLLTIKPNFNYGRD